MLYNIIEDRWDPDLLELFGIPESMMPESCGRARRSAT